MIIEIVERHHVSIGLIQIFRELKVRLKRKIFYIPGFDPRSEAYYKKLLLSQFPHIKEHQLINEKSRVVFETEDLEVDYEILSWHKEVQAYWGKGVVTNLNNTYTLFKEYVFKGAYFRLYKNLSKKDAVQKAFSVYFFLIWLFLFSLGGSWLCSEAIDNGLSVSVFIGSTIFILLNIGVYKLFDGLNIFWVTRIMNFFVLYANKKVPKVLEREKVFKAKIITALQSKKFDEVIVVAHSVGTILCVDTLSDLVEKNQDERLTVVTLGHCVSAVSMVKNSEWFNDRLAVLAHRNSFWIDVTAGKDAVAFYKVNPGLVDVSKPNLTLSAGFHRIFTREFYKAVKWNFYKIHFLYLYNPKFPENSAFNYQKLLFDPQLFKQLNKAAS
ncbi:MAG: hypothetical protein U9N57_15215 [Pseudomonadota bacterium]|nr:hypothetical protein [Pseudomonadota bacterium]